MSMKLPSPFECMVGLPGQIPFSVHVSLLCRAHTYYSMIGRLSDRRVSGVFRRSLNLFATGCLAWLSEALYQLKEYAE